MLAFPMLVALVSGTVALMFGIVVFGLPIHWSTAPLAIPVALLAALAFAPFAIGIGGAVLAVKQAGRASGFVVTGLSLVGGFFFPVALLCVAGAIVAVENVGPKRALAPPVHDCRGRERDVASEFHLVHCLPYEIAALVQ